MFNENIIAFYIIPVNTIKKFQFFITFLPYTFFSFYAYWKYGATAFCDPTSFAAHRPALAEKNKNKKPDFPANKRYAEKFGPKKIN